ncbi:uncharacterized protein LOC106461667 isoform X2 [Limulus polyphemus]|uniref:Uncharacterized protein LOC106461667 isoform X2 n=1 Tax=Limulus polyphemus TaxID=6850 RepID=A0ABM1SL88_LIMPO|nr:uncharacterized protein LOC106461667 isoform X2 [Limulus polyphemus]
MEQKTGLRGLQAWCRMLTQGYRDVDIKDLSSSFRDGLAFCALIHRFRPDLIDYESLSKENILHNNTLAFGVAEKQLGIPALLDAEDMVMYKQPDKLSIATYLSQFYQYFERGQHGVKSEKPVVKRPLSERNTEISPFGPPAKLAAGVITRKSEVCQVCQQKVFILERLLVDGKVYHRTCFKCAKCGVLLKPGAYVEGDSVGTYECVVCPKEEISRQTYSESKAYRKQVSLSPAEKLIPMKSEPEKLKISTTSATARRQFFTSSLKDVEEKDNQESSTGTRGIAKDSYMSKFLFGEGNELSPYHKENTVHSILSTTVNNCVTMKTPKDNEPKLSPAACRISTSAVAPDRTTGGDVKIQKKDVSFVCRENQAGNVETFNAATSLNESSSKQMKIYNIDPIKPPSASKLAEFKNGKGLRSQETNNVTSAGTNGNEATSKTKSLQNENYVKKIKKYTCKKGVGGECLQESLEIASIPEVQTKRNKDISGAASYETPIPKKWSPSSRKTELPDISTPTYELSKKSSSSSTCSSSPSTFASQLRLKLKPVQKNESYCINRSEIVGTLDVKDSDKFNVVKRPVSSQFDSHGLYVSVTSNIDSQNTTWKQYPKELTVSELHVPFTELRKSEEKTTSRVAEAIKQISSRGGTDTSYNIGAEKHKTFKKTDTATSPSSKEDIAKTQTSSQEHIGTSPLSKVGTRKTQTSSSEYIGKIPLSKVDTGKTQTSGNEYIGTSPLSKVGTGKIQTSNSGYIGTSTLSKVGTGTSHLSKVSTGKTQTSSREYTGASPLSKVDTGKAQTSSREYTGTSPLSKVDTGKAQTSSREYTGTSPLSKVDTGKAQTSSREYTGTSPLSKVGTGKTQTSSREYIGKMPLSKVDTARKQISNGIVTQIAPSNKHWMAEKQSLRGLDETKQLISCKLKTTKGKNSDGFLEDVVKENIANVSECYSKVQWCSRSIDNVTEDSSTEFEVCPNISGISSSHLKSSERRMKKPSKLLSVFTNPENYHQHLNQFGDDNDGTCNVESPDCEDYPGYLNTFEYFKEKNSNSLKNIPATKKKVYPTDYDPSFIPFKNEREEVEGSVVIWKDEKNQHSSTEREKKLSGTGSPKVITVVQRKENPSNPLTLTTSVETKGYDTIHFTSFSQTLKHSPVISGTGELEQSTSSSKVSVNKYATQSPVINHIQQSTPFPKSKHINSKIEFSSSSLKKQSDSSSSSSPQTSVRSEGANQPKIKESSVPNKSQEGENTRETKTSTESNTFGYWKKKKHPAPPVPIPQRREVRKIPMEEIQTEMKDIDHQQDKLENIGREIEMKIRNHKSAAQTQHRNEDLPGFPSFWGVKFESESALEEELILELFELVNLKNALFRRQAELVYLMRSQKLEEEQVELEFQIRCLMNKSITSKSEDDQKHEEELLQKLLHVVEQRNEIVECIEINRQIEIQEDQSIQEKLQQKKNDLDEKDKAKKNYKLKKMKNKEKARNKEKDELEQSREKTATKPKKKGWLSII